MYIKGDTMVVDVLKDLVISVINRSLDIDMIYGKVIDANPLKVVIGENITLDKKNIVVIKNSMNQISDKSIVLIMTLRGKYYLIGGVEN